MRALLVANPRAGRVRNEATLTGIQQRLCSAGMEVSRLRASDAASLGEALRSILREVPPDQVRVVVAGGDGTVNAALPALLGTGVPLAIVPVGSVNVLARELGLPRALPDSVEVATRGVIRRVDLGIANGRPFSLMAGLGFDAAVVASVAPRLKSAIGSFAYIARGLRILAQYAPSHFRIATEERSLEAEAWLAVIANASRYTYHWTLAPEASIDDGWLDLCLFQSGSRARTLAQVMAVLGGCHADKAGVLHVRAREFRFECDPPVDLQVDGDVAGRTPAEVRIAPMALSVMVPGPRPRDSWH